MVPRLEAAARSGSDAGRDDSRDATGRYWWVGTAVAGSGRLSRAWGRRSRGWGRAALARGRRRSHGVGRWLEAQGLHGFCVGAVRKRMK